MKLSERLIEAKSKIDKPEKWCKGTLRVNKNSKPVAFCAYGSFSEISLIQSQEMLKILHQCLPEDYQTFDGLPRITHYNDAPSTTHSDIMALFDRAIKLAQDRGD